MLSDWPMIFPLILFNIFFISLIVCLFNDIWTNEFCFLEFDRRFLNLIMFIIPLFWVVNILFLDFHSSYKFFLPFLFTQCFFLSFFPAIEHLYILHSAFSSVRSLILWMTVRKVYTYVLNFFVYFQCVLCDGRRYQIMGLEHYWIDRNFLLSKVLKSQTIILENVKNIFVQ